MEKNKYYNSLVALFESTKEKEVLQEAPSKPSKNPAITQIPNGIDQQPVTQQPFAQPQQMPVPEDPMMDPGLSDADYLQGDPMMMMEPELSPIENAIEVSEQKKLIKLLGLYRELMNYTTVFYDNLEDIDTSTLETEKNQEIRILKDKLSSLKDKLRDYIVDRYADETYEKSLYVYILLRTELLTIVKLLRKLLGVDKNEQKDSKETQNKS